MHAVQANQLDSLRAAQKFLDEHADRLPTVSDTGARRRLDAVLASITECATDQEGSTLGGRGETGRYQRLRLELIRSHMTIIVRVAEMELHRTPQLSALTLPRGNPSPAKLAAAALGMASAVAPFADVFIIEYGLKPDFIQRLTDASDAMLASYTSRAGRYGRRRGATVGLAQKLKEGRLILGLLDSLIESAAYGDARLLASWHAVTHVRRIPPRTAEVAAVLPPPAAEPLQLPAPTMKLLTSGEALPSAEVGRTMSLIDTILAPFRRLAG